VHILHLPDMHCTSLHDEKEHFLGERFDGYLSKPMEQGELITEMKRVMYLNFGSRFN